MFRRQFIQLVALSSAVTLNPVGSIAAGARTTVIFQVKGFTCVTCAVGLDTLLGKEKGLSPAGRRIPKGKSA